MRRIIREEEPPKPSTRLSDVEGFAAVDLGPAAAWSRPSLTRLVRGELDWIVMKALEKDRTRRYETASGTGARRRALPARTSRSRRARRRRRIGCESSCGGTRWR